MARHTMRGFAKRIRTIAVGVENNANSMMRKTVITVASAVALRTPVDTGRARANWQTHIGSAPAGLVSGFAEGTKGSTGGQAVAQATNAATQEMGRYAPADSGKEVYISNNLPYIGKLNQGSSKQAPAGFIEAAVMAGLNAIRKARLVK